MIQAKIRLRSIPEPTLIKPGSQPLTQTKNYPFVDLIRFLSMMGIVWAHTDFNPPNLNLTFDEYLVKLGHVEYYIMFKQVFKFGVLSFFMISGILVGSQLDKTTPFAYFKRRIESTLKPFLLASGLFALALLLRRYMLDRGELTTFGEIIQYTYFRTMFWYLPNYLICLSVLLLFKNYLKSFYFGVALFVINIVYSLLTVYNKAIVIEHTDITAIFSYTFYLWLGVYLSQKGLISKIKSFNPIILLAVVIAFFMLSSLESYLLFQKKMEYFNILRISNQAYSIAMFIFLIRVCGQKPNFGVLDPRKESYGIYLYHGFFSFLIFPKIYTWTLDNWHINWYSNQMGGYLLCVLFNFVIVYLLTIILVKALIRFKLAFL